MFTPDDLNKAISTALSSAPDIVPAGKKLALVAYGHADGSVQAAIAYRVGDHWQVGGEVDWHGGQVNAGASVKAIW